ncbi:MAG: hypothetical protein EZS28_032968 [Streblomastix strix]|uniref:Uncharacterized protein n=1 Tax=Streblomastix strix TaxID=222440 RepID=A0A5J4ULI1_9EUKA|nr:MAG: hypothetical protein EZS28_032968 [Streblomastix strix]
MTQVKITEEEILGDVALDNELKARFDTDFQNFCQSLKRRGMALILLHEAVVAQNVRKMEMMGRIHAQTELLNRIAEISKQIESSSPQDLKQIQEQIDQFEKKSENLRTELENGFEQQYNARDDLAMKYKGEMKQRKEELTKQLNEMDSLREQLNLKRQDLVTAQIRFTQALALAAVSFNNKIQSDESDR